MAGGGGGPRGLFSGVGGPLAKAMASNRAPKNGSTAGRTSLFSCPSFAGGKSQEKRVGERACQFAFMTLGHKKGRMEAAGTAYSVKGMILPGYRDLPF